MGFEFKSDQPEQSLPAVSVTTLSVNPTQEKTDAKIANHQKQFEDENLVQDIFAEGEEEKLAIQFIEENELYVKFMLWCGLQDQLKKLKDSVAPQGE